MLLGLVVPRVVRDYLALPEVVFVREHWLALALLWLVVLLVLWVSRKAIR